MVRFYEQLMVYSDILFFGIFLVGGYYYLSYKKRYRKRIVQKKGML
jgi:hypothetical protein